ncbi:hypothetical protein [Halalkalibacter flavus]|uniref:hypothetical protein n=1 Tax=Halalkalibacter flavus TaxID=3090668 RepID=UPI002FC6E516
MKFKKVHILFIAVSVVLLISIIALWILPSGTTDDVNKQPLSSDIEDQPIINEIEEEEEEPNQSGVPVLNQSELSEMENAIERFLTVWYTEKDRNVIENEVRKNMTDELSEQFFGTERPFNPIEAGGDEHDLVEFEKILRSIDIYVKEVDGHYAALYEADTSFRIGENTSDQKALGRVKVSKEDGNWLISEYVELDVLVE